MEFIVACRRSLLILIGYVSFALKVYSLNNDFLRKFDNNLLTDRSLNTLFLPMNRLETGSKNLDVKLPIRRGILASQGVDIEDISLNFFYGPVS